MKIEEKERISWEFGETKARTDATTLRKFVRGEIDEKTAIARLEKNNGCRITRQQFWTNLKWLGWMPR